MKTTINNVDGTFNLAVQNLPKNEEVVTIETPTNHIVVIDCSGSMHYDLPAIRQQLKNKLPFLMKDDDTITIIWFSGRNQYGVLIEGLPVRSVKDLSKMNNMIDKYLQAMGLTGFVQPLSEVKEVIKRLSDNTFSLFFLTDGYDNQWSQKEILDVCDELQVMVSSATFVEYGYYCNRPLMIKMAEAVGGNLIFSENFIEYEPIFEKAMQSKSLGGKKIDITLDHKPVSNIAYSVENGNIVTYTVKDRKVLVPEGTENINYFVEGSMKASKLLNEDALYAGIYMFAQRMKSDEVFKILKLLGDVRLIKMFSNCFGKQKYSDFQREVLECVVDPSKRLTEGFDPNLVPDDDAYTVLDLLDELTSDDDNKFYPSHPAFKYNRIGRKTIESGGSLSDEEQTKIEKLLEGAKTVKQLKEVQAKLDEMLETKPKSLSFKTEDDSAGVPISNLTLNESRPNVSTLVAMNGTVNVPENDFGVPEIFPTKIYRNYTIIRDGIVNVDVLPVSLSKSSFMALKMENVVGGKYEAGKIYEIDIRSLPVINRRMVKSVSAKELFTLQYDLMKLKGKQKVYKHYRDEIAPKVSEKITEAFGTDAEAWLKEMGITDNGFSPKKVQDESTDVYMGKELKVSIKGLSSLPKVEDVMNKMLKDASLTISQKMLVDGIEEISKYLETHNEDELKVWLSNRTKDIISEVRKLNRRLSEIKFAVVVGQVWFNEFESLDDNTLTMKFDGTEVPCTVEMKEKEFKI